MPLQKHAHCFELLDIKEKLGFHRWPCSLKWQLGTRLPSLKRLTSVIKSLSCDMEGTPSPLLSLGHRAGAFLTWPDRSMGRLRKDVLLGNEEVGEWTSQGKRLGCLDNLQSEYLKKRCEGLCEYSEDRPKSSATNWKRRSLMAKFEKTANQVELKENMQVGSLDVYQITDLAADSMWNLKLFVLGV